MWKWQIEHSASADKLHLKAEIQLSGISGCKSRHLHLAGCVSEEQGALRSHWSDSGLFVP